MLCNYHTHTTYCDGKSAISDFVAQAIHKGFDHLGFSAHAPIPGDTDFSIQEHAIPDYLQDIAKMKQQQDKVQLFSGLECDFIPGATKPFSYFKEQYHFDYLIGGIHLVKPVHTDGIWFIDGSKRETYDEGLFTLFGGDSKRAVTRYWEQLFEMVETETFDIIAHADKIKMHNQGRFFSQDEPWYVKLVDHAVTLIKRENLIMEINTRGIYKGRCDEFYPSDYMIRKAVALDIPFVVSSDAHKADELGLLHDEATERLRELGVQVLCYLEDGVWKTKSENTHPFLS